MVKNRAIVVVALFATFLMVSCSKKEPVKTAEEQKAEFDKAAKATRENAVFGEQVKAMDKAKAVTEKANELQEVKMKQAY